MTVDKPAQHTKALAQQKRLGEAIRFAKEYLSSHQENDSDYLNVACALITCYLKARNFGPAEKLGREIVRKFPDNPAAHTTLVQALLTAGKLTEAELLGRETIRKFPENRLARTNLAQVLRTAGIPA
jgi:predicted Zn-dependent protease